MLFRGVLVRCWILTYNTGIWANNLLYRVGCGHVQSIKNMGDQNVWEVRKGLDPAEISSLSDFQAKANTLS